MIHRPRVQLCGWLLITGALLIVIPPGQAHAATSMPAVPVPADPGPQPAPGPAPGPTAAPPGAAGARQEPGPDGRPAPSVRPSPAAGDAPGPPISEQPGGGSMPPADTDGDGSDSLFKELFDVPGMIVDALTGFLSQLVDQAQGPVLAALGQTLLATPDVSDNPQLVEIWTGTLGTTVAAYVLFILVGGVLVMGHETVQTRYSLKQIAPRLVIGLIAAATSLPVMSQAITLANAGSLAITSTGVNSKGIAEQLATGVLRDFVLGDTAYLLVLHLIALVLVVGVLIGYGMRIALVYVLVVVAPLALACHALPVTEGLARLWWRGFFGCLVIQLAQSATLIVGMRLYFADNSTIPVLGFPRASHLGTTIAGLCLFWILLKIPGWTAQVVFRSTPVTMPRAPLPLRMMRSVAIAYVLRGTFNGARGTTPPTRGWAGGQRPGPGPTRPPSPGPPTGSGGTPPGGGAPSQPAGLGPSPAAAGPPPPTRSPTPPGAAPPGPTHGGQNSPVTGPAPGPRAVPPPVQGARARQLALRIPVKKVASRPGQPVQTWLPVPATRRPRQPTPSPPPTPPPSTAARGRQTVLPISVPRVPARPPRPVQLRLPLERPPHSPGGDP